MFINRFELNQILLMGKTVSLKNNHWLLSQNRHKFTVVSPIDNIKFYFQFYLNIYHDQMVFDVGTTVSSYSSYD